MRGPGARLVSVAGVLLLAALLFVSGAYDSGHGSESPWGAILAQGTLLALLVFAGPPLGALAILLAHGLSGGVWGQAGGAGWLRMLRSLPLLALVLLVLLPAAGALFDWASTAHPAKPLRLKSFYLNMPFFLLRNLGYVLLWGGLVWLLRPGHRARHWQYALGLMLWLLGITFFSFDWLMSLQPLFYSDVFGLLQASAWVAAAFALGALWLPADVPARLRRDIGSLWLSLLLAWLMLAYFQWVLIWSGNIPLEAFWYESRAASGWLGLGLLSVVLFFLLPFLLLLPSRLRGQRRWQRLSAGVCLLGYGLQMCWLIFPAYSRPMAESVIVAAVAVLILALLLRPWLGTDLQRSSRVPANLDSTNLEREYRDG